MEVKMIFWSCSVALVGYFAYQQLSFVTVEISMKEFIPAKRSDVFQMLMDNPKLFLKVHPLCTGISNVIRSQDEDGHRTVQFDYQETVVLFGFKKKNIMFQVTLKALQENAVIQNTASLLGGFFLLNQRWLLSDANTGSEDGTLLEDHFTFTSPFILARISKPQALDAHTVLLENIKKHFRDSSGTHE